MIPALPETLAPPAPFPLVLAQSHETEFVAPGIRRGIYRLQTSDGPLVVTIVAIDPHEPTVRLETVVANDRLVSAGETVSSMAHRTRAVAGVNADYFDIGQTNQPLNLVVRDGALLRTPSKRVVLDVRADRSIAFENVTFSGTLSYGATTMPLTSVNEWPPQGGAGFLTPAYGIPKASPDVNVLRLVPVDEAHLTTQIGGDYRVVPDDPAHPNVVGPEIAFGPAARALGPLPAGGDDVHVSVETVPALDSIANAVGGGPLLVASGAPANDPNAPAPEERDRRFPVSGAATTPAGSLLLVAVDGRRPSLSIGVTRPQFAALMLGFGATDAMAFDSGGSATLVARVLGDVDATVLNAPSDGDERPVADGLFAYSDAALGPSARLVVRPPNVVALPDTDATVTVTLVDAAGHPTSAHARAVVRGAESSRIVELARDGTRAAVSLEIVRQLARLDVTPDLRDPDPHAIVRFLATGIDARGRNVELGGRVRWSSDRGRFVRPGELEAPARDARVVATAGGTSGTWLLRVGRHRAELALGTTRERALRYDFSAGQRASYADLRAAIPGEPLSFTVEIDGDGGGVGVRAAFVNAFGERRALTLARSVDWIGWRSVTIPLPSDLNPPVQLVSLYAVDTLAGTPTHAAGSLAFRDAYATVAGTP